MIDTHTRTHVNDKKININSCYCQSTKVLVVSRYIHCQSPTDDLVLHLYMSVSDSDNGTGPLARALVLDRIIIKQEWLIGTSGLDSAEKVISSNFSCGKPVLRNLPILL